jgi:hypothetical protein
MALANAGRKIIPSKVGFSTEELAMSTFYVTDRFHTEDEAPAPGATGPDVREVFARAEQVEAITEREPDVLTIQRYYERRAVYIF